MRPHPEDRWPYPVKTGPADNSAKNMAPGKDPEIENNLDDIDIQKQLEAKFDELFGSLA